MSTVKKILSSILILMLFACSTDDSIDSVTFNPPNWLIGVWDNESETAFLKTYIITDDAVILINQGGQNTNYSELIENDPYRTLIELEISNTVYKYNIIIDIPESLSSDYIVTFNKITDTDLLLNVNVNNESSVQMTYFKE